MPDKVARVAKLLELHAGLVTAVASTVIAAAICASAAMMWGMRAELSALQGEMSGVKKSQSELTANIRELRLSLSDVYTSADADRAHGKLQDRIDDHEQRLRNLERSQPPSGRGTMTR